ncbi:hypothetical protein JTB14_006603 [Gonioctena quinquepunctata]|nr:hypothetical protein JTB14_006603 [Gonioctena quinquepunctata]
MDNLRLYISTYNVGTSNPDQELKELFALSDQKNEKAPDFFILGFQEVKAQPHNMVMDTLFDDPWTLASKEILQRDYIKLKSVRLQGLLLLVFGLRKHLLNIREIESEYTRTGLAGMWGNKGAVTIRLSIYGCSICFVNSHLSAHDSQLKDRVEDYNSIIQEQEFHVAETSKIFYHERRPAWCDRILYCVNQHNYENVTLKVDQLSYKSHPSFTLSDHRPVTAEFVIKVFSDYSECVIEFDKISQWQNDNENIVFYTITKDVPETTDDWIGLFKNNFNALDDYVTYEYISKCTNPVDSNKSANSEENSKKPSRFKVTFPEVPSQYKGSFCLVYFSQTEDKVSSVLGISNSFRIV